MLGRYGSRSAWSMLERRSPLVGELSRLLTSSAEESRPSPSAQLGPHRTSLRALVGNSDLLTRTFQNSGCQPKRPALETGFAVRGRVLSSLGEDRLNGRPPTKFLLNYGRRRNHPPPRSLLLNPEKDRPIPARQASRGQVECPCRGVTGVGLDAVVEVALPRGHIARVPDRIGFSLA